MGSSADKMTTSRAVDRR